MESIALEPKAALEAHGTKRISELDSLRGFLLVWMTLTHLPTRVSAYSNQVIGYLSAAEGFILLAAVLTGQIQSRAKGQYGDAVARKKLFRRVLRIYSYHLVLLGTAFCLGGAAAVYLHRKQLQYLLDFFIDRPAISILAAPLLLYNPPLLDILPMYIVFMLLTPIVLWAAERRGWTQVLGASGCVWLLAQCNLRVDLLRPGPLAFPDSASRDGRIRCIRMAVPVDQRPRLGRNAVPFALAEMAGDAMRHDRAGVVRLPARGL